MFQRLFLTIMVPCIPECYATGVFGITKLWERWMVIEMLICKPFAAQVNSTNVHIQIRMQRYPHLSWDLCVILEMNNHNLLTMLLPGIFMQHFTLLLLLYRLLKEEFSEPWELKLLALI